VCKTPEEFKAWSQNLAHENVLTTFTSYGAVSRDRQADVLNGFSRTVGANDAPDVEGEVETIKQFLAWKRMAS